MGGMTPPNVTSLPCRSVGAPDPRWWRAPLYVSVLVVPALAWALWQVGATGSVAVAMALGGAAALLGAWLLPPRRSWRWPRIALCAAATVLALLPFALIAVLMVMWPSPE
ncbi:MAG: hypothetical protein QOF44_811 [Streptomyces sp.]|nr:hypothetical protein [Streptomyces sp.]